jgi:2-polyprenyl-6-methoxyphenol hydroxylase-like FAD-dependent oxidoreductase
MRILSAILDISADTILVAGRTGCRFRIVPGETARYQEHSSAESYNAVRKKLVSRSGCQGHLGFMVHRGGLLVMLN